MLALIRTPSLCALRLCVKVQPGASFMCACHSLSYVRRRTWADTGVCFVVMPK